MGLWSAKRARVYRVPDHIRWEFYPPEVAKCCLEGPPFDCAHWADFRRRYLIAHLIGNAVEAVKELRAKTDHELTISELREGIKFAVGFGAIAPTEIPEAEALSIIEQILRAYRGASPLPTSSDHEQEADGRD